jgi:hypothetical protein
VRPDTRAGLLPRRSVRADLAERRSLEPPVKGSGSSLDDTYSALLLRNI